MMSHDEAKDLDDSYRAGKTSCEPLEWGSRAHARSDDADVPSLCRSVGAVKLAAQYLISRQTRLLSMDDEQVIVPPEVYDELDSLHQSGDLEPDDRERAIQLASERGYDETVNWLESVGDEVYTRAARGEFVAGDEV